ncbi:MAG: MBL fold metallo-hydrolase [Gammaproteobacteria bacterium]
MKVSAFITALAVTAAAFAPPALARPEIQFVMPDWNTVPLEVHDLGHGVHFIESFGGNVGVVADGQGVLLVDAEYPEVYARMVKLIAQISPQPVRYLIDTHWHWDHTGANGNWGKAGALIISSEETRQHIADAQKTKPAAGTPYAADPFAIPKLTTKSRLTFRVGGQTLEVIHTPPAHTDGDLIVRYVEANVIQTGDTFFHGFYPDIDIDHGGTIDGMIALYDTLYAMCDERTKVIPGHGDVATRADIREYQAMLRDVRSRVAKAIAAGQTEEQLIAAHPLDDLDVKWGGNLIKAPYLLAIVYEDLKSRKR